MSPTLQLEATAFTQAQLIHADAPQIALAGRSNVGKSSLVNALAGRKKLAKVSATPGKTRSVNYYRLEPSNAYIVDLPGYGYAKCSQKERLIWAALLEYYLRETRGLRALAVLLDARLPPQKSDQELIHFASTIRMPIIPVLTKTDKCSKRELDTCKQAWSAFVDPALTIITSSEKRIGIEELWGKFLQILDMSEMSSPHQSIDLE